MKSLAELQAIKDKMKDKVILREGSGEIRVVVGMATCGIAAGARPVLNEFVQDVAGEGLSDKVTYVKMTADKAKEVVAKHLKGGQVVSEYTIGAYQA